MKKIVKIAMVLVVLSLLVILGMKAVKNKKAKASKPMWKDGTLAPKAYDNSGFESAYQSSATSMAV